VSCTAWRGDVYSLQHSYLLSNYVPSEEFALRERAQAATKTLLGHIEGHLDRQAYGMVRTPDLSHETMLTLF
jgi:hypothetical protein